MQKKLLVAILAAAFALTAGNLFAQRGSSQSGPLEVKLASPLPRESPWGRTLDRIAAEWNRVTNGQVRLNVRHGGVEGTESKMHLSLASNTIQGAVFTSFGLQAIDPSVMTLSAPFLIRNERELTAVMQELQGDLETRLNRGNYFMLAWSKSGFVNIFTKDPVYTPDDLRKQKIASSPDASDLNLPFKTLGFQIVEMDWTEAGTKLNAGVVNAAYQNPAAVAAFQLHTVLKNMMSTNVAPVLGGIVINQVTWRKIAELNPRYQQELLNASRRIATEFDAALQKTVNDAIQAMNRVGLKVNQLSPAQEQLWYNEIDRTVPSLLGTVYDRELYQRVNAIVTRVRGGR